MKLAPVDRHIFKSRVRVLMAQAAFGQLDDTRKDGGNGPISPCKSQPDIWELRVNVHDGRYRMYYAEHENRSPEMVALHVHKKAIEELEHSGMSVAEQSKEINRLQNLEMELAQERYGLYEDSQWGHTGDRCVHCVR